MKVKTPREIFKGFKISRLADKIGIDRSNFYRWKIIPLDYVAELSLITGIPKETIRPDYYK